MRRATIGRLVAGGMAAVVAAGAGTSAAFAASTTSVDGNYRVATAAVGDVDETLALSGSVETASRRDESFAVAGTVDAVEVAPGQHVDAGAVLATVATDSLQSALDDANSALATAQQSLVDDLAAQSATTTASSASSSAPSGETATAGVDTAALQQAADVVEQRQQALLDAITAAGTAIETATTAAATATTDSTAATAGCAAVTDPTSADYVDLSALEASDPDYATKLATAQAAMTTCQTDLAKVATAQATVQTDQAAVQTAQAAVQASSQDLDAAIRQLQQAAQPTPGSGSGTGGSAGTSGSGGAGDGAQAAVASKPSSADIVADRAAIAAAEAQVGIAQHDLDAHTLTASITGTVASIGIAVGDTVSAGSSTQVITILGDDGYTVTTSVPLAEIPKLKAGEAATVELPALGRTYDGTVSSVGVLNVATDSSTPAYDVTIAIDAAGDSLRYGSAASIEVAVASVTGVLTVPLSAVTTSGGASTVTVLEGGKTSTVAVTTGAVGDELIEIDSGLQAGDRVVLADFSEGVPTSTSSTGRTGVAGLTGGGQTFGGPGTFTGSGSGGRGRRSGAGTGN